jgi:sigma-B regulation protein RsbU (phosphoserine phosphatase)
VGAFWLNLQVLFPHPLSIVKGHSSATHAFIYVATVVVVGYAILHGPATAPLATGFLVAEFVAGLAIISTRRRKAGASLERRQLTLVYFGSGLGLSGFFILGLLTFVPELRETLPLAIRMLIPVLVFLLLLISPISFAYAFGRYRLLEIEGRLRRGTRYFLLTVVMIVILFLLLYGVSNLLLTVFSVQGRGVTLAVALVLALSFAPLHRKVQTVAERQFYPERARLRGILQGFLASTATIPDRLTFWEHLSRRLRHGLNVQSVIPVLRNESMGIFEGPDGSMVPMGFEGELASVLESSVSSMMVDEILVSERVPLSEGERQWLVEHRIGLLLPMLVGSRLMGFLALEFPVESPELHAEDLRLLVTLSSQIALRYENLLLLEENVEKKRMEEQLAMARQVQERLLPQELPPTPGLEVTASCTFSLEVAGDYYDVVSLKKDRTLLAVGDVSGKGAGAAMIMANLRASLRALAGSDMSLGESMVRLNVLTCNDTAADQFITLFVALFEPSSGVLSYVNAGHNPPRIIRLCGVVYMLEAETMVLGVLPQISYAERSVHLYPGDILLAFTDGVSEAMDENEVEFGESRVVEAVQESRELALDDALAAVRAQVEAHVGGRAFADDFTLLLARALGNTRIESSRKQ